MDILRLYLSPRGRIGVKAFWIGWLILRAVSLAPLYFLGQVVADGQERVLSPGSMPPTVGGLVAEVAADHQLALAVSGAALGLFWVCRFCLYVKRLHDAGWSAWLMAFPLGLEAADIAFSLGMMSYLVGRMDGGPALPFEAMARLLAAMLIFRWATYGLRAAFLIAVGARPTKLAGNRYVKDDGPAGVF